MKRFVVLILIIFIIVDCNSCKRNSDEVKQTKKNAEPEKIENTVIKDRDAIVEKLKTKIESGKPLIVHAFVALYGYNRTSEEEEEQVWSDGTNPKTNLYWGAGYGIKTYFKKNDNWDLILDKSEISNIVAERLVFTKVFANGARVYLIADAYYGYEMYSCLTDYFEAITELNLDSLDVGDFNIPANGNADLIVFNGHNGLMNYNLNPKLKKCKNLKESAVIACHSAEYFNYHLEKFSTYPLIVTKELIPAEAYILASIIEPWAMLKDDKEIRKCIVEKYCSIHNLSIEESENIFSSGWE